MTIQRTVDVTGRAASFTVAQIEAEGFRFSHRKGDLCHFIKDETPSEVIRALTTPSQW